MIPPPGTVALCDEESGVGLVFREARGDGVDFEPRVAARGRHRAGDDGVLRHLGAKGGGISPNHALGFLLADKLEAHGAWRLSRIGLKIGKRFRGRAHDEQQFAAAEIDRPFPAALEVQGALAADDRHAGARAPLAGGCSFAVVDRVGCIGVLGPDDFVTDGGGALGGSRFRLRG